MNQEEYGEKRKEIKVLIKQNNESIELAEKAIFEKTREEQHLLKITKNLKENNIKKLKDINMKMMKDNDVHPLIRASLWLASDDCKEDDWVLDNGPMERIMFNRYDSFDRHMTINVKDHFVESFLWEIGYHMTRNFKEETQINLDNLEEAIKTFDGLSDEWKEKITSVIDDMINQNVYKFTLDW